MCRCKDTATSSHGVVSRLIAPVGGGLDKLALKRKTIPAQAEVQPAPAGAPTAAERLHS